MQKKGVKHKTKRMPGGQPAVGCAVPISRDIYEKMWELYKDGATAYLIAKKLNISHTTIKKYINKGSPRRGFEPLRKRLELSNKKIRERIIDVYATKKKKHYDNADKAFTAAMGIAMSTLQMLNDYIGEAKATGEPTDPKRLSTYLANGKDAHALMEGWRGTLKGLAIGEESEDMLHEIEQYNETGILDSKLRARLQEAINEAAAEKLTDE